MASRTAPKKETGRDRSDKHAEQSPKQILNNAVAAGMDMGGEELLKLVDAAEQKSLNFLGQIQRSSWERSIKAFHNQHHDGSKYRHDLFKQRSKIFRPKTRSALRKNLAAFAAAMFSNADVVSVSAERDSDPVKQASAEVIKQDLNYRLNRTTKKSGLPWFLMAMGACLDANLHGVCVSKTHWEYNALEEEEEWEVTERDFDTVTMQPIVDEETGEPMVRTRIEKETKSTVICDRPMVTLIPPEHALLDPGAPWHDPIQESLYFIARYPMALGDLRTMMKNPGKTGTRWLPVDDEILRQVHSDYDTKGVRLTRDEGSDRYDQERGGDLDDTAIIWVYEVFFRIDGIDYTFWTAGTRVYLSKVRKTREAYPEQMGDRPYTYGYGQIETHRITPMSAVESWQQMQVEANDLVNLRLDTLKQSLAPIAKVKQGTMFDWKQLNNLGAPNATVIVRNPEDLEFDRAPGPAADSYQEMNSLNVDFDELSGQFSAGSVQTNRQLNETVGGMRLLSGSSNAITEFDLRVIVETWVEPTVRQIVRAIQYWETDEALLAIAGEKAKMIERFGVSELTDRDLQAEVSVKVNVGIGAADPMQKIQKLGAVLAMLAEAAPFLDRPMKVKGEELAKELMGSAGYNDGMRFFVVVDPEEMQGQSPEELQMQMEAQLEQAKMMMQERIAQAGNQNKIQVEQLRGRLKLIDTIIREEAQERRDQMHTEIETARGNADRMISLYGEHSRGQTARRVAADRNESTERMNRDKLQSGERQSREKLSVGERMAREKNVIAERAAKARSMNGSGASSR